MADLKPVYRAVSKDAAETALDELKRNGAVSGGAPVAATQMENLSAYSAIRRISAKVIYNSRMQSNLVQLSVQEALTKTKGLSRMKTASLKLLYLGTDERSGKNGTDPELEFDIVAVGDLF